MIVFDLKCDNAHQFESWFRSSSAFEQQKQAGLVICPYCDSSSVTKALMAPNVSAKGNQTRANPTHSKDAEISTSVSAAQLPSPPKLPAAVSTSPEMERLVEQAADVMSKIQEHVEKNCDNVGDQFAEEARKIHYGEADERGIYGNASADEAKELIEEGIDVLPLPVARRTDA
ncbi:DUF1178 family protein [Kordiimonas aquimaris]|uniref:DUF1178 family protein n=1 Tax=Kordiimonas aquimaris TaxID=707591 RepID=UPI0021D0DC6F|nr:DUF1178 family protein [Kordiimonas aquimaris]